MVYITFPRVDLDGHPDLVIWRGKSIDKKKWKTLKASFLPSQARHVNNIHAVPKCWFSELPQGDNFVQDVEHFRPKANAKPLDNKGKSQWKSTIDKKIGFPILQDNSTGAYPWLKFDYRNYRFVTGRTNRGGAKHDYFPIALNSNRLVASQEPWATKEYSFLLDPTNLHDANQLWVLPSGQIRPKASKPMQPVLAADYTNLDVTWQEDKFNYIRAWVTICLYRLEEGVLINGRKEVYNNTLKNLNRLVRFGIMTNNIPLIKEYVQDIYQAMLPSAPFALAARCALADYSPDVNLQEGLLSLLNKLIARLKDKIQAIEQSPISWTNP